MRIERTELETNRLHTFSAEVKKDGAIRPLTARLNDLVPNYLSIRATLPAIEPEPEQRTADSGNVPSRST